MLRNRLLLLLLLLPSLALAQAPLVPLTWRMQAPACIPAETATPYRFTTATVLAFLPGTSTRPQSGRNAPLVVRCPITGQDQQLANRLLILGRDPDGHGAASRILVELLRHRIHGDADPVTEVLTVYDSNQHGPLVDGFSLQTRPIGVAVLHFHLNAYTVQISLRRASPLVLSPRVALVGVDNGGPPNPPD
jgi:hypothetical protein